MSGKMPRRERPDDVIHARSMDKDNTGFAGVDVSRIGVAVDWLTVYLDTH
jgi:hypothetical protein